MDVLTHIFLPLTVAYVLRQELFNPPYHLALAGFGLLPDFDKVLGYPGLLHSFVTLVPISFMLLGVERWYNGSMPYSGLAVAFIGSHLVLDLVDGGPLPLLYPFIKQGIGLAYPVQIVFGAGPTGIAFEGAVTQVHVGVPQQSRTTYPLVKGAGIASFLAFLTVYIGYWRRTREEL